MPKGNKILERLLYYLQPFVVFLAMFGISAYFSTIGVEPHHDGIMLKPAIDFAEGKMLFKESFSVYGALTILLQGLTVKIFGEYLIVIRILTAFFYGLTGFFLWLLWRRFLPGWLTNIACMIWIMLAPEYFVNFYYLPWSSVYALFFLILSCYSLILYIERKSLLFVFFSGASAVLSFWCRQPVGVFLCFSLLAYLLLLNGVIRKTGARNLIMSASAFIAGIILPSACFLFWLVSNGALHDWWLQQICHAYVFAIKENNQQSLIASVAGCLFVTSEYTDITRTFIWVSMPVICLFLLARFFLIKKLSDKDFMVLALIFGSLASWMQYYPVLCIRHVYWAATPMIGLFTYFAYTVFPRRMKLCGTALTTFVIFSFFGYDIVDRAMEGIEKADQQFCKLEKPNVLAGVNLSGGGLKYYLEIQGLIDDYMKKHPESGVISIGMDPLYLTFQHNNNNFHQVYVNWEEMVAFYPDYNGRLAKYIKEKKPMIVSTKYQYPGYRLEKFLAYMNLDGFTETLIFVPDEN